MLAQILKWQYPDTVPFVDWVVRDTGNGPYIAEWHVAGEPQPLEADLLAMAADWLASRRKPREVLAVAVDYYQWLNAPATTALKMARAMKLIAGIAGYIAVTQKEALVQTDLPEIDPTEPEDAN